MSIPPDRDVEAEFKKVYEPKWLDTRLKKLAKWAGPHHDTLKKLLSKPIPVWEMEAVAKRIESTAAFFEAFDDTKRRKLWEGLFPKLAMHIERAWQDAANAPYQNTMERFPFRAPGNADLVAHNRARFFLTLTEALRGLDQDAEWLATWGGHLQGNQATIGAVLAAALRAGGDEAERVRAELLESLDGSRAAEQMGGHTLVALLNSPERSDWEAVGKLLLAAQRQEGVRQAILESVDEANPEAFRYMLGLILEHDLARFSATVRAFDVWLGMQWEGGSVKIVNAGICRLIEFLDDPAAAEQAVRTGQPEEAHFALWTIAYSDAMRAMELAAPLLDEPSPERRFVGVRALESLVIHPAAIEPIAARLVAGAETDDRVLSAMLEAVRYPQYKAVPEALFEAVAGLYQRLPARSRTLKPIVWPWCEYTLSKRDAADAMQSLAKAEPARMIPFAGALDSWRCACVVQELGRKGGSKLAPDVRSLMLELIGDSRTDVYEAVFEAMKRRPLEDDEAQRICSQLHRTAAKFRRAALDRLTKLQPPRLLEVAGTLLADRHVKRRAAGLELAAHLIEKDLSAAEARALIEQHRDSLDAPELAEQVDLLVGTAGEPGVSTAAAASDGPCLGLMDPAKRAKPLELNCAGLERYTDAAWNCLRSLAELFLEHAEEKIEITSDYLGECARRTVLLSENFPSPRWGQYGDQRPAPQLETLPLRDLWQEWERARPAELRDDDGLELVRAWAIGQSDRRDALKRLPKPFQSETAWSLIYSFRNLTEWLPLLIDVPALEYLVQLCEDRLHLIRAGKEYPKPKGLYSTYLGLPHDFELAGRLIAISPAARTQDRLIARLGALRLAALEYDVPRCEKGPTLQQFVAAFRAGLATEHDFYFWMVHERPANQKWSSENHVHGPIDQVTRLRSAEAMRDLPTLIEAARRMRDRIIEVELTRGERSGPASPLAADIKHAGGAEVMLRLASALGRDKLVRQDQWGEPTRAYSFSRLITVTAPEPGDTPERFAELAAAAKIPEKRLLELAFFAPQWSGHIEHTLGFEGLEDAVWWVHAHTKQMTHWREEEFRDMWASRISERTELEADDLEEGAVDVAWFGRMLDGLEGGGGGRKRWDELQKYIKYASSSGAHKRAELFASAMLGEVKPKELITRIDDKRHQDSVRALGLIPLPEDADAAKTEALDRYKRLQEFRRQSRKFGSQRQASEGRAVDIGLQNLARTAGYRDPRRLEWAMEREAVADLAAGPVTITEAETTITLAIDAEGAPQLTILKKDKPLKNVPAALRKREDIAALRARIGDLRRQTSRMRLSLEATMCRGDTFTGPELAELWGHPLLQPMLARLVWLGEGDLAGYPIEGARALQSHSGHIEPIGKRDTLRLAHPVDLLARGDWSDWQRECFGAERVQPFKQVFREVYPKTATELDQADSTRRYAGHQVNPRQALALLKQRQWVIAPEEGVRRTWHDEGIIAGLWFAEHFFTPADVDGLTLEAVSFQKRSKARGLLHIADVPDRIFSETTRDLDLVVSVAHAGGVDPEATASTVEMRAALLGQTCQLLGLSNVRIDGTHAMIDGALASYTLHLGSAVTHVAPGRALPIVAVHSQYRGRLFLPFADSDPRTAEVMAKALLLARDDEIRDPKILAWIRG